MKEADGGRKPTIFYRTMVSKGNSPGQKLAREQEGEGEIEEERRRRSIEARKTESATTFSVVEEATIASAGNNRACSDGRSGENECSNSKGIGSRSRAEYGSTS